MAIEGHQVRDFDWKVSHERPDTFSLVPGRKSYFALKGDWSCLPRMRWNIGPYLIKIYVLLLFISQQGYFTCESNSMNGQILNGSPINAIVGNFTFIMCSKRGVTNFPWSTDKPHSSRKNGKSYSYPLNHSRFHNLLWVDNMFLIWELNTSAKQDYVKLVAWSIFKCNC